MPSCRAPLRDMAAPSCVGRSLLCVFCCRCEPAISRDHAWFRMSCLHHRTDSAAQCCTRAQQQLDANRPTRRCSLRWVAVNGPWHTHVQCEGPPQRWRLQAVVPSTPCLIAKTWPRGRFGGNIRGGRSGPGDRLRSQGGWSMLCAWCYACVGARRYGWCRGAGRGRGEELFTKRAANKGIWCSIQSRTGGTQWCSSERDAFLGGGVSRCVRHACVDVCMVACTVGLLPVSNVWCSACAKCVGAPTCQVQQRLLQQSLVVCRSSDLQRSDSAGCCESLNGERCSVEHVCESNPHWLIPGLQGCVTRIALPTTPGAPTCVRCKTLDWLRCWRLDAIR
jgi:hypothetical protein